MTPLQSKSQAKWIVFGLFLVSGLSGLVYEIVWMRMLIRVFGITLYATSTIISIFMGGLALGSWAAGKAAMKRVFGLRLYAYAELALAGSAWFSSAIIQRLPQFYASLHAAADTPGPSIIYRICLSAMSLLPPTFIMGATLPLLSQWVSQGHDLKGRDVAFLYGLNTLGAVFGILLAGFFGIAVWGETACVGLAVILNALVGLAALGLSFSPSVPALPPTAKRYNAFRGHPFLYLAAAAGLCAIGYEVLWTRLLILVLGTSVYAFSTVLAVYLVGIALGSLSVARWVDRWKSPGRIFGFLEMALSVMSMISLWVFRHFGLAASSPAYLYSPVRNAFDFLAIFSVAGMVILPLTILMGAAFPILERAIGRHSSNPGAGVGSLYAWNTMGGVLGSFAVLLLLPSMGLQATFCLIGLMNLIIGVLALAKEDVLFDKRVLAVVSATGLVVLALFPARSDFFLDILRRRLRDQPGDVLSHSESAEATVTVYGKKEQPFLLINGIAISAKSSIGDLMAHVPIILHPHPASALVICFGAGNTFRTASYDIGRVDAVELLPSVVRDFPIFHPDADRYLSNPNARIFIDDGRNYVLLSKDHYDVIIVDASPPIFSAGTVNLYSFEFLNLAKRRLGKSGIFALWVPLPCFATDFWMIARNFEAVFGHAAVWSYPHFGGMLLMGSSVPLDLAPNMIARHVAGLKIQKEIPWITASYIVGGFILSEDELKKYSLHFPLVTDNHPYTEFPLERFLRSDPLYTEPDFILQAKENGRKSAPSAAPQG